MAIVSKLQLESYQFGVHVQKRDQLYALSGKILSHGRWRTERNDRIIIVEMNENTCHEAFFYRELNGHNHIIQTFGYIENNLNAMIYVQEFARYGDLSNLIMDNEIAMTQRLLFEMFYQIADAMSYVASKSIVHGDLGCRNVLVYRISSTNPKSTLVKLTDFGLARSLNHPEIVNADTSIIPVRYCAPEILRDNSQRSYSEKSDVYSMGVFMWEALSNAEMPYASDASDDTVKTKKLANQKLNRPTVCDRQFWILMEKCWYLQPTQRITFAQMIEEFEGMNVAEVEEHYQTIRIQQPTIPIEFQLNIDVRMGGCFSDSAQKTYEAEWIKTTNGRRPIVLKKFERILTDHEIPFYTGRYSHNHLIHNFGFVQNDLASFLLLQERSPHGNLQVLLERRQFQPNTAVLVRIFLQIIEAMIYINQQNLIHGDLRCANVLVFQMNDDNPNENLVKLKSFSLVRVNDPTRTISQRLTIPVRYCALEILRSAGQSNYSELSDVYSMGVLMWEACSQGEMPYASSQLNSEVRQRKLNREKLTKPLVCNRQIWAIIDDCWHNEPSLRYKFSGMKARLSQVDIESYENYLCELDVDVRANETFPGNFGKKVYQAEWIRRPDPPVSLLVFTDEAAQFELPFYQRFNSQRHIVKSLGLVKNRFERTILLQERAPYGNLLMKLQETGFRPTDRVLLTIFLQITDAMIHIASKRVVHRDLQCENVLVFRMHPSDVNQILVKLTNFHLAYDPNDSSSTYRQPLKIPVRYCAPELLSNFNRARSSELSDVYSMGILMWQAFANGQLPYGADDNVQERRLNNEKLAKPNRCNEEMWNLIQSCWTRDIPFRKNFQYLNQSLSHILDPTVDSPREPGTPDLPPTRRTRPEIPRSNPIPPPLYRTTSGSSHTIDRQDQRSALSLTSNSASASNSNTTTIPAKKSHPPTSPPRPTAPPQSQSILGSIVSYFRGFF